VIDSESCSDEEQINLEEQMKTFNMTELVWSLCEILWIDLAPGVGSTVPANQQEFYIDVCRGIKFK